jgi:ABC-type branched-subunit amino acid transport system permease subunit
MSTMDAMAAPRTRERLALALIFTLGSVCVGVFLLFDSQAALGALFLALAVAWGVARRLGWSLRIHRTLGQSSRWPTALMLANGAVLLAVLHDEHFALLMLGTVLLYTTACIALNIQTGFAGLTNFAGAAFFTSGGYTMAVVEKYTQLPHITGLLLGGLVSATIGLLLMLPVLRTKGFYSALVTIAFGVLFSSFLQVNETLGGAQGLQSRGLNFFGWDMSSGFAIGNWEASFYLAYAVLALIVFVAAMMLSRALEWSYVGINLDATRSDELVAMSFGLNLTRWKVTAFVLGNFMIGFAGALHGGMVGFVSPQGATFEQSLLLVSIIVLGGVGNNWGALVAALIVVILPEKLHALQEYRILLFSVLVVVILLFSPRGLVPRSMRDLSVTGGKHG